MLYNPLIRFKNRNYIDFNCSLKLIKLRKTLSETISSPEVYLRDKTSEEMFDTILKFAEMRKLDRAVLVRDFDLFPEYKYLITFDRKYGDTVTYEDMHGIKKKKKKRAKKTVDGVPDSVTVD